MKRIVIALVALLGVAPQAQQAVPEIPFDSVPNFLKLPPDMNLGEASGVAVNSKGDVAVFTRSNSAGGPAYGATASQVLLFDKTGKFLREIGKGLYAWSYAHAILTKAAAYSAQRKIDPAALINARLYPDMIPLVGHVEIVSEIVCGFGRLGWGFGHQGLSAHVDRRHAIDDGHLPQHPGARAQSA